MTSTLEVSAGFLHGRGVGQAEGIPVRDGVRRIQKVLQQTRYRRDEAAHLLGMSRTTLWRRMKDYGLS